jgi:uncharacterized oligopeptide transporter (OPT) family protein
LVVDTALPYPEGVAAAEVLKVGAGTREGSDEAQKGLKVIVWSSLTAALFALVTKTRFIVEEASPSSAPDRRRPAFPGPFPSR